MKKWELSLLIAIVAVMLCCAVQPESSTRWWTAAFSPLCDKILTADCDACCVADCEGADVILRSKLLELLKKSAARFSSEDTDTEETR